MKSSTVQGAKRLGLARLFVRRKRHQGIDIIPNAKAQLKFTYCTALTRPFVFGAKQNQPQNNHVGVQPVHQ